MAKVGGRKSHKTRHELVAFAAGLTPRQTATAYNLLTDLEHPKLGLRRSVYVLDSVSGTDRVKIQSAGALFSEAQLALRNLYAPLPGGVDSDLYLGGFEMLCLDALLRRDDLEAYLLVRGAFDLEAVAAWLGAGAGAEGTPYLEVGSDSAPERAFAFRAAHPALPGIVEAALDLYQTGAVLGLPDYSLSRVLGLAAEISRSDVA